MDAPLPDPVSTINGFAEETRAHPGYLFNNHRRGSPEEAVVQQTLAGACFFETPAGRSEVGTGHAMLFTHDDPSRYGYPPGAVEPYRQRFVSFRLAALRPWFERLRGEFGPVLRMAPEGEAAAELAELGRLFRARGFRDRFEQSERLQALLVALYREQVAAAQTRDPVEFGYHYLRDHFRSPLNLKELAARCGVSREHFIRAFGKRYGEPPGEMLRRLRLEQAHRMLRATEMPVREIAPACGFAEANTFCRAYRLRYGASPGASREGGSAEAGGRA
jgi:AraC-like DNA-binding protein